MYIYKNKVKTSLKIGESMEGERLEQKVARILANKEPIEDGAPIIYTDRKDGVLSAYNIRTDRWEVAAEAMDSIHRSAIARRDNVGKGDLKVVTDDNKDSEAKSTHDKSGTDGA